MPALLCVAIPFLDVHRCLEYYYQLAQGRYRAFNSAMINQCYIRPILVILYSFSENATCSDSIVHTVNQEIFIVKYFVLMKNYEN